ncbi:MAG: homoserine kinase [Acidobacteria bacterium]|nr:homoserine kinase [Acidobacteriota bacterium]MBK9528165.1 homoserine kinase [Acidobacteriota bacterium]MBP7474806.1 homoserine kinase [Pyrinomonadaceae bacterium]MBP9108382.1 homoserine kinase [Pyrinomonadaceae bacterium]
MDEVSVLAPATVANVVCGFDCLGFALSEPCDEMTVRRIDTREVRIINRDDYGLPTEPEKNVAGVALLAFIEAAGIDFGFEVEITKHIMPGSGIGSSAASACGAVVAANRLIDDRFTKLELVELAMAGEALASGSRHADNLAPCIYGGFTLVRSTDPLDIVEIDFPSLFATVIHPQIEIKTSEARAMLPKEVPLKNAIRNWSNLGALVAALAKADYGLISRSLEDTIIEPLRKSLIPKFDEVKGASLQAGALGGSISGSGPSIFMLSETPESAEKVGEAMSAVYTTTGIDFNTYVSQIHPQGIRFV